MVQACKWNLFLDDIRDPLPMFLGELAKLDWVVMRTCEDAIQHCKNHGLPDRIAFDHDLGWDTLPTIEGSFLIAAPDEGKELPSGYDFAKWLVEFDLDGTHEIPKNFKWTIHSSNPVGKANIDGLLTSYMKYKNNKDPK
jgi:hypothetical protein